MSANLIETAANRNGTEYYFPFVMYVIKYNFFKKAIMQTVPVNFNDTVKISIAHNKKY
jgi:hypothetical protein